MLIVGLIVVYGMGFTVEAQQQPPPPTPKGQLGGAPRLTPLVGGDETVTPAPVHETPTAEANGTVTATTEVCVASPRSLDEVVSLIGATPGPSGVGDIHGDGVAADAQTVDAVTRVIQGFVACINAGDQPRALAFMTDAAVSGVIAETGWDAPTLAADLRSLAPRPSADRIAIRAISEVRLLPDGRVVAGVEFVDPSRFPVGVVTHYDVVMTQSGNRWLIDRMTTLSE
jgi:hypothetical protein